MIRKACFVIPLLLAFMASTMPVASAAAPRGLQSTAVKVAHAHKKPRKRRHKHRKHRHHAARHASLHAPSL